MPLYLVTPFDREPAPAGDAEAPPAPKRNRGADLGYILIRAAAFLGSIYLAVLGLPLLGFLLLVGGDPALLFTQLGNLSAHYLAAEHAAQAGFVQATALGLFGIATLVVIWRLPRFIDGVAQTLSDKGTAS